MRLLCIGGAGFVLVSTMGSASGGVIFGDDARATFEALHTQFNEGFIDFEAVPTFSNLNPGTDPFGVGVRFSSHLNVLGNPMALRHVEVSNAFAAAHGNTIVGSPGGSDDGRVGYQIEFDNLQARAGIERLWNTAAITRFYNSAGELLAEHTNTQNAEFVGWIGEADDMSTWVARIELDGGLISGTRQVGYSDDLFFGQVVPAPAAMGTLAIAGLMGVRRRR